MMRGFLAGLGSGIALGILLAPQSGEETRQRLRSRTEELGDSVREQAGRMRQSARRMRGSAKQMRRQAAATQEQAEEQAANSPALREHAGALARLNNATREELMEIRGIGPVLADRIIEGRPFGSLDQVLERGIVPESTYRVMLREFDAA